MPIHADVQPSHSGPDKGRAPSAEEHSSKEAVSEGTPLSRIMMFQRMIGNQAVQRLVRSGFSSGGIVQREQGGGPEPAVEPEPGGEPEAAEPAGPEAQELSSEVIEAYVRFLMTENRIECHQDSDDKAMAAADRWVEGRGLLTDSLSVQLRVLMIREMIEGDTRPGHERAMVDMLERTRSFDRREFRDIVDQVGEQELRGALHDTQAERFTQLLSQGEGETEPESPSLPTQNALFISGGDVGASRVDQGFKVYRNVLVNGSAQPVSNECSGELFYIQDVRPFIEYTYKDGSRAVLQSRDYCLDTANPYPFMDPQTRNHTGTFSRSASDAPHVTTGVFSNDLNHEQYIASMCVNHQFRMFMLFRPSGGQEQVLLMAPWTLDARAENDSGSILNGQLQLGDHGAAIGVNGQQTTAQPETSSNVTSLRYSYDNSGRTDSSTLPSQAQSFRTLLNSRSGGR